MQSVGFIEAITRWWHLALSPDAVVAGIPLVWLARVGTILQASAIVLMLLEVVGEQVVEDWADELRRRLANTNLALFAAWLQRGRRVRQYAEDHFRHLNPKEALSAMEADPHYQRLMSEFDEVLHRIRWKSAGLSISLAIAALIALHAFANAWWPRAAAVTILVVWTFELVLALLAMVTKAVTGILGRYTSTKLTVAVLIGFGTALMLLSQTSDVHSQAKSEVPPPLRPASVKIERPFCVGPFDSGATGGARPESSVRGLAQQLSKSRGGRILWLLFLGSVDKQPLRPALQRKFGSNKGLALARAQWVSERLSAALPKLPGGTVSFQGPSIEANAAEEMERDRHVIVYIMRESEANPPEDRFAHDPEQAACSDNYSLQ